MNIENFKLIETLLNISYTSLWTMDDLCQSTGVLIYSGMTIKDVIVTYEHLKTTFAYKADDNVKNQIDRALELCYVQLLTNRLNNLDNIINE